MSLGVEYGCPFVLTGPDGTRAVFNDDTDEDFVGILSAEESSGLDSPDVREDIQARAEADGAVQGNNYFGARPVVLTGTIIATSKVNRNEKVARLKRASLALREDAKLEWAPAELQEEEEAVWVYLNVRRQQPLRVTKGYTKHFQLPLVAGDPTIRASAELSDVSGGAQGDPSWAPYTETEAYGGLAADANYVYYASLSFIGRVKIGNGEEREGKWITAPSGATDVAVNATHIFWADQTAGTIGRAEIGGGSANNSFISELETPRAVAVNATHIFWADSKAGSIGRALLNGSEPDPGFISSPLEPYGVAVDGTYIYWTDQGENAIGRALLNGTGDDTEFITPLGGAPSRLKLYDGRLVWGDEEAAGQNIWTANTDGTNARRVLSHSYPSRGALEYGDYLYYGNISRTVINRLGRGAVSVGSEGGAPVRPRVRVTNIEGVKLLNPTIELASTGEFVRLNYELTGKNYIDFDFATQTVMLNGVTSLTYAVDFPESTWWSVTEASDTIYGPPGIVEVKYQDAWL